MPIQPKQFRYFVRDALRGYSDDFLPLNAENPYSFRLNDREYVAHISLVHESGKNRPDWENRIQLSTTTRDQLAEQEKAGKGCAVLGVCPQSGVFFAWEAEHAISLQAKSNASTYGAWEMEAQALAGEIGVHRFQSKNLQRATNSIAFSADLLGVYLENMGVFHRAALRDESLGELQAGVLSADFVDTHVETDRGQESVRSARTRKPRSPQFRQAVMDAYESACCVCGRQLGLVEAAHIIPHAHNDSTDDVMNGIALCVAHHRMYDSALLLPGADGTMCVNQERAEFLRELNLHGGLDEIAELDGRPYRVPTDINSRPAKDKLQRGYDLRINS